MSLEDVLGPGEKVISECKPFYATSRRIIRYDERAGRDQVHELEYHELTSVELVRKPNHPLMIMGTLALLAAILLTTTGLIIVTAIPALMAGIMLLVLGARGKLGYYRLNVREPSPPRPGDPDPGWDGTIRSLLEPLGLMTPTRDARWCLDYKRGGSFIATIRVIVRELPEV